MDGVAFLAVTQAEGLRPRLPALARMTQRKGKLDDSGEPFASPEQFLDMMEDWYGFRPVLREGEPGCWYLDDRLTLVREDDA